MADPNLEHQESLIEQRGFRMPAQVCQALLAKPAA